MKKTSFIYYILLFPLLSFSSSTIFWGFIPQNEATIPSSTSYTGESRKLEVDHEKSSTQQVEVVFLGNSITHAWRSLYPAIFSKIENKVKDISGGNVVNYGVSAETTNGTLYNFITRNWFITQDHSIPKVAVVLIGTNNLHNRLPLQSTLQETADGVRAIHQLLIRRWPGIQILNIQILPTTWHTFSESVNVITKNYLFQDQIEHLDHSSIFLSQDGSILYMPDGIHPVESGRILWEPLISSAIEEAYQRALNSKSPTKILLYGGMLTKGESPVNSYRSYLDGMVRSKDYNLDFVGSIREHDNNQDSVFYYQYDWDHEGKAGRTSTVMRNNLDDIINRENPDIAVLEVGTEDIGSVNYSAQTVMDDLEQMVADLRKKQSEIRIVITSAIPILSKEVVIEDLNKKIQEFVASHSSEESPIVFSDIYTGLLDKKLTYSSNIIDSVGAYEIATILTKSLECALGSPEYCYQPTSVQFQREEQNKSHNLTGPKSQWNFYDIAGRKKKWDGTGVYISKSLEDKVYVKDNE
jgi:lysophospholipase L1-like esterase